MTEPVAVVGVGAATWDELWRVPCFSADEDVREAEPPTSMGGGPVATALCVLARFGQRCALVDAQGDDAISREILRDLTENRISTHHVQIKRGTGGTKAIILVRAGDGARQIVFAPAQAGEPKWGGREDELLKQARLLHLNGRHENAARAALQTAVNCGVTVSFDGGAGRYRESIRDLVLGSHIRIVAMEFARRFTGSEDIAEMLNALAAPPAEIVVITDGVRGSFLHRPGGAIHHEPAGLARDVVDTTGCGDIYHGGFLHGWLSGWEPEDCAKFGSGLAARNAEGLGSRYVLTPVAIL